MPRGCRRRWFETWSVVDGHVDRGVVAAERHRGQYLAVDSGYGDVASVERPRVATHRQYGSVRLGSLVDGGSAMGERSRQRVGVVMTMVGG